MFIFYHIINVRSQYREQDSPKSIVIIHLQGDFANMIDSLRQRNLAPAERRSRLTEEADSEERLVAEDDLDRDADKRFFIPDYVEWPRNDSPYRRRY